MTALVVILTRVLASGGTAGQKKKGGQKNLGPVGWDGGDSTGKDRNVCYEPGVSFR